MAEDLYYKKRSTEKCFEDVLTRQGNEEEYRPNINKKNNVLEPTNEEIIITIKKD